MKVFENSFLVVAVRMKGNIIDLVKTFGPYSRLEFALDVRNSIVNDFSRVFIIDLLLEKLL